MQFLKRLTPVVSPLQNSVANTIYVDKDNERITVGTGASGTSERTLTDSTVGGLLPDGSAGAPSLAFASQTTTGLSGGSGLITLSVAGSTALRLDSTGLGIAGNDAYISRSAAGIIRLHDGGGSFSRLQFGGTTSSFPCLKRSTTTLAVRLADDSGDGGFQAGSIGVAATLPAAGCIDAAVTIRAASATATPAGGAAGAALLVGSSSVGFYIGTGAPTVSAAKGSLYSRTDATTTTTRLYINTDGGTTWTTFTTAA